MGNRLTFHGAYRNALGKALNKKHNQREGFEKESGKGYLNEYFDFYAENLGGKTFSENEDLFYKEYLGPTIKSKNDKAVKNRQYGRTQTVAQYQEKHPPQEWLMYLGTQNVNRDDLEAVLGDYLEWLSINCWDDEKGGVCPLNAALHMDEKTPHVHLRMVYLAKGKDGEWEVSQNKALAVLGYQAPDPSKPIGKHNNAKMTFTAACREKLFEIAKSHGLQLQEDPLPENEVGLPIGEYVQREKAREAAAAEKASLQAEIAELRQCKETVKNELEQLQKGYQTALNERMQSPTGKLLQKRHADEQQKRESLAPDAATWKDLLPPSKY